MSKSWYLISSYSCGYRKVFEDYAGIISQKYPDISVVGANYDPLAWTCTSPGWL